MGTRITQRLLTLIAFILPCLIVFYLVRNVVSSDASLLRLPWSFETIARKQSLSRKDRPTSPPPKQLAQQYYSQGLWDSALSNTALMPDEKVLQKFVKESVNLDAMLDASVGAGRTTAHFIYLFKSYYAYDVTPHFVDAAKKKFPKANIVLLDTLSVAKNFRPRTFDFVLCSYNAIDYLNEVDSEMDDLLFSGVRQLFSLLLPEGVLAFSSHNLLSSCSPFFNQGANRTLDRYSRVHNDRQTLRTVYTEPYYVVQRVRRDAATCSIGSSCGTLDARGRNGKSARWFRGRRRC